MPTNITTFVECFDSEGRVCVRLNRANGRILARWRTDMPGYPNGCFVREKKAVCEYGLGELCYTAIQCALYASGLSDFSPAVHAPELGYRYVKRY